MNKRTDLHILHDRLNSVVGSSYVLSGSHPESAGYLREPRDMYIGEASFIIRPGSVDEVSAIMSIAYSAGISVTPQGGNTGLVGGQVPLGGFLLSLDRLTRIREIDISGSCISVDGGVILSDIHAVASEHGFCFPLHLGSEGSCRVGGILSTNAGGTSTIAYGNARNFVLGLEVVLPNGEIWDGMNRLRKNNTGYDLKHLFIGSEGTLGIITGAVLELLPAPSKVMTFLCGLESPTAALDFFTSLRSHFGRSVVTSFEIFPRYGLEIVLRHGENMRDPLTHSYPWYVLCELSFSGKIGHHLSASLYDATTSFLHTSIEDGLISDAVFGESESQRLDLWEIRHLMSLVQKNEGATIKHDVSVPVSLVPTLIERGCRAVLSHIPDCHLLPYGHLGDGNIHFNIVQSPLMSDETFRSYRSVINDEIFGIVRDLGGSVSAEHGIGQLKRMLMGEIKSSAELSMMHGIKRFLDEKDILNPAKVLPDHET